MALLKRYLRSSWRRCSSNNIRFRVIGRAEELAPDIQDELADAIERTASNTGLLFNIALNYGGRAEIVDAARRAIEAGVRPERSRRAAVQRVPLHRRPARSRSADPHQRRDARQQLPALADRLRRDLGHRHALARLPRAATCSRPSSHTRNATAATAASRPSPRRASVHSDACSERRRAARRVARRSRWRGACRRWCSLALAARRRGRWRSPSSRALCRGARRASVRGCRRRCAAIAGVRAPWPWPRCVPRRRSVMAVVARRWRGGRRAGRRT